MTRRPQPLTRLTVATGALALLLAACARAPQRPSLAGPGVPPGGIDHGVATDQLVLRIDTIPGPTIHPGSSTNIPSFSLFGDGTLVTLGPHVTIYPSSALPSLHERHLTEAGVQAVLAAAGRAGLLGPDRAYDTPPIPDAGTTIFTVIAGGSTHTVRVLGLGSGITDGTPMQQVKARQALSAFAARLDDLTSWLPAGSVGTETPYRIERLQVNIRPGAPQLASGLSQESLDWPLSPGLVAWGSLQQGPGPVRIDVRCGAAAGPDLAALLPSVRTANTLTAWRSGGDLFALTFTPLLPDQAACPPSPAI